VKSLFNRGFAYLLQFDHDRALADFDTAIRIDEKQLSAYHFRGVIFQIKGDDERAIADFTKARQLGSADTRILIDRGSTFLLKGNVDRGVEDYDAAIAQKPDDWMAYLFRGIAFTYGGKLAEAQSDFKRGAQLAPKVPYFPIWLHIAERRAQQTSTLAAAVSRLDMMKWPAPAVRMFLGEDLPTAVLAYGSTNVKTRKYGACEATFFVAEHSYLAGQRDDAVRLYKETKQACRRNFVESVAAHLALRSLGESM
jgi:lipoprotein NlpI